MCEQEDAVGQPDSVLVLSGAYLRAYLAAIRAIDTYWRPQSEDFMFGDGSCHTPAEIIKNFQMSCSAENGAQVSDFNRMIELYVKELTVPSRKIPE